MTTQNSALHCPATLRGSEPFLHETLPVEGEGKDARKAVKIALVVVPQFSTLDVGAVLESAEQANNVLGYRALDLASFAFNDTTVQSKSRLSITCDHLVDALDGTRSSKRADVIILCCGSTIPHEVRPSIKALLKTHYGRASTIIGIGNAAWLFAEWGLLNGRLGTVHWQYQRAFSERYIDVDVKNALYVDMDRVLCCAGEAATLDLMFKVLSTHISETVAHDVLNRLLVAYPRSSSTTQPGSQERRLRHLPDKLQGAMRLMAEHIESPLTIPEISSTIGLSTRQLERLFKRHLRCSPKRAYVQLQLEQALQLIEQTEMSFTEISIACGMSNPSVMSRHFKRVFGKKPSAIRHRKFS